MSEAPWWQSAVIYQVYPRSFQDTDGDGVGDLRGILERLDHFASLGVDAIWVSPIYPSPMADFGYDVADYTGIDPHFGTMADFDALLAGAHERGLKLILDFVPNHSSDQHPWFQESRSSRENPKRDWYIWRDAKPDGSPPNNWISDFGGSSWTWDEASGQYYLRAFLPEQPDLNWRNPEVRAAMYGAMRFWLDKGVDGFRLDVLWHVVKREDLADNPPNPHWRPGMNEMDRVLQLNSTGQPESHDIAAEMRTLADDYEPERVLIGEIYGELPLLTSYYGTPDRPETHLPFNFQLVDAPPDAATLAKMIGRYYAALPPGGWPNFVLGNHDRPRIATRWGEEAARLAAMLLLTLKGTPTLYYGDELGLADVPIPPERVQDPRELRQPGIGLGRDPVRTPMPWDAAGGAGFSAGEPWLPLNPDWPTRNVTAQEGEPTSMLELYRSLLSLRRSEPALSLGEIRFLDAPKGVLAYERTYGERSLRVLLNFAPSNTTVEWAGTALLSTLNGWAEPGTLYPFEGLIIE